MAVDINPAQVAELGHLVRGKGFGFDDDTYFKIPTFSAHPTPASDLYGMVYRIAGAAGIADGIYMIGESSGDAAAAFQLAAANSLRTIVDTGGAFATPVVLTAADSGKVILLDDAAGLDFTLPAITAANVGMQFEFLLKVEATSNSYRWTAQTGDAMTGLVIIYDKDLAEGSTEALQQIFRPTTELICTIGSADDTQGVLVGGRMRFLAWSATGWDVRGELVGDGALATPFS